MTNRATLLLEDGRVFRGRGHGFEGEAVGEVVFNTSMTGYQEILTDPSYAGQIVTMTYPMIGNTGINRQDVESRQPFLEAFVIRQMSPIASNWRATDSLDDYLTAQRIPVISEIDTRALVRHIRLQGSMRGIVSRVDHDEKSLLRKVRDSRAMVGWDLASKVSVRKSYSGTEEPLTFVEFSTLAGTKPSDGFHVVAYDFGIKTNILRDLVHCGARVTVVPSTTPSEEVLKLNPDGIFLSNGPGDPEAVDYAIRNVRELLGKKPIFGICLGHQILGLAFGGRTFKLKFGHHGGNQPVLNSDQDKVEITAQNHGFAVDADSLPKEIRITHINLNDRTVEGMEHRSLPAFSVQYHPEASPGPHDSYYLFEKFFKMMKDHA